MLEFCADCPLWEKKIALLATTNAFRINAPTKYLVFRYVVLNEQILFPQIPHTERFVLVHSSYQLDKGKNQEISLKSKIHLILYYFSIFPCTAL